MRWISGLCVLAATAVHADTEKKVQQQATKLQQTLGSAIAGTQSKDYDVALSKIKQLRSELDQWSESIAAVKSAADAPPVPEAVVEPPAESVPFSVNSTHVPAKCARKSVEGATMKVHYVGKLVSTGKIFASSFHTGSQPFRFTLGGDEVIGAWNQGLGDMCEGERRRLMVPWHMGYGEKGTKGVPPYSDLQYDFELVELSLPKIPKKKSGKAKAEL